MELSAAFQRRNLTMSDETEALEYELGDGPFLSKDGEEVLKREEMIQLLKDSARL